MGIDFRAYRNLAPAVGVVRNDDNEWTRDGVYAEDVAGLRQNDPCFEARGEGLDLNAPHAGDVMGNEPHWSYSGYNRLREMLAEFAGYPLTERKDRIFGIKMRHDAGAWSAKEGPFWELINFTDCDGTLGPKACSKLRDDFRSYAERAAAHPDEAFRGFYEEMSKMFEWAGDGTGAIVFC
jgi:hypothetical protein